MKKYEIKLEGNDLVWNRMKREIEQERKLLKKNEITEYEEKYWLKKAETNNGNLVIPISWVKSVLINAAKQTRLIPHFETNKKATYTRYVQAMHISLDDPIVAGKVEDVERQEGFYSSQPGKQNSGKVWKIFPKLNKWDAKFVIIDPQGRMLKNELNILLEHAGNFIGIGDQRGYGFGRFDVVSIKEVK